MSDRSSWPPCQLRVLPCLLVVLTLAVGGCATGRMTQVSPDEIPELERRLAAEPDDGSLLLRYSAALYATSRCDSATAVARRGSRLRPADALGPLVIGQCLERANDFDQAIAVYGAYLANHRGKRGAAAVATREMLARRGQATARARAALQREAEQAQVAADPQIVAVLPIEVVGDSTYRPLSRGLAQILTSDLALLQRFRMVERLQIGALMDELELAGTARVDQTTAARMGRLLRAGRLVQGMAALPERGDARLDASVVVSTGEIASAASERGRVRDLMQMEKRLVIGIANRLGYTLSQAERQLILENGTQNLTAFLLYSRALEAEDAGDYRTAAALYARAVQVDPNFQLARDGYEATAVAPDIEQAQPGDVTVSASEPLAPPDVLFEPTLIDPAAQAIQATELDVAATTSEQIQVVDQTQTTSRATGSTTAVPPPTVVNKGTSPTRIGTIRIIFRLP